MPKPEPEALRLAFDAWAERHDPSERAAFAFAAGWRYACHYWGVLESEYGLNPESDDLRSADA